MKNYIFKDKKWNGRGIYARCGITGCNNEESSMSNREMFKISTGFVASEGITTLAPFANPEFEDIYLCNRHKERFARLTYNWRKYEGRECLDNNHIDEKSR